MFVSRYKQIALILTMGIGLGILVPVLMQKLPLAEPIEDKKVLVEEGGLDYKEISTPKGNYFVHVQDGSLSIIQGGPQSGQVLLSGLDVKHWPQEMQSMVTQVEFHSLDEVQSFIDSMSEELWLE